MILDIQYQCVIKTSEQAENDPHAVKARVYPAGDGEIIEALWNIGDLEPDFGVRRSYYIHFESIPSGAKRELEQMKPQPYIKVRNDGDTEYRNNITLKVLTDKQITKEQLQAAMKNAEMLAGYYTDWQADLRQNDVSSKEHTAPFPFKVYLMARDIIGLAKLGATEEVRENFKLPKGKEGIDILLEILKYLRNGKKQNWIADKIGFHYTLWNKEGKFGDCLRKLKQRANQSEENRARLISRFTEGVEDDEYNGLRQSDSDWLFCSKLLNELEEEKLYTKKDKNRKEVPMGVMNDRGGWDNE